MENIKVTIVEDAIAPPASFDLYPGKIPIKVCDLADKPFRSNMITELKERTKAALELAFDTGITNIKYISVEVLPLDFDGIITDRSQAVACNIQIKPKKLGRLCIMV